MWQALHDELAPHGFTLVSVAIDTAESAGPWLEAVGPRHPALIDADHRLADVYRIVNVPTSVWIDEQGRIVRPNDAAFGSDQFLDFHGIPSAPHREGLRAWVCEGRLPLAGDDAVRAHQVLPTPAEQLARTEYALAWWLSCRGRAEAAERHFVHAGELAPHDFTIRRGSLPIRGKDPMGADAADLFSDWIAAGRPYYPPMQAKT